jgi:hypothetical protein
MKKHEGFKNLVYISMKNNPNKLKSYYLSLNQARRRKKGSGRSVKIAVRAIILQIKKYSNHKSGRSEKKAS